MLQHLLGPQESWRHRDARHAVRLQLGRPVQRQDLVRHLHRLRHRIAAATEDVVLGDLDDQAAAAAHHQQRRVLRRDDPRGQSLPENRVGVLQVRLPEVAPLPHQRIFAGDAVDEDVDAFVFAGDAPEQRLHLGLDGVIDANCDCDAAGGIDHRCGLVDRFPTLVGRRSPFDATPGAVHRGARLAEGTGDPAAGAARGSGNHGNLPRQRLRYACGHAIAYSTTALGSPC